MTDTLTLDRLPIGQPARIAAVDWDALDPDEGRRLRALGIDTGAIVTVAHRGVLAGRDPLAVQIGRMTVALRRAHACTMRVEPEARSTSVEPEARSTGVAPEASSTGVAPEARSTGVEPEARVTLVEPEVRVTLVEPEARFKCGEPEA